MVCCEVVVLPCVYQALSGDSYIVGSGERDMIIAERGICTDRRLEGEAACGKPCPCSVTRPLKFEPWSKRRSMCRNHGAVPHDGLMIAQAL